MTGQDLESKLRELTPARVYKYLSWILASAAGLVGFVGLIYFSVFHGAVSDDPDKWGVFGDFFGGTLNPLLSFLGLIALLLTIVLQSKEMEFTREELRRTAEAQEAAQVILAEQIQTQRLQQFEGTFFSLLNQLQDEYRRMEVSKTDVYWIHNNVPWMDGLKLANNHLRKDNRLLGRYFRILYQMLKFIGDGLSYDVLAQKRYANMVRAVMTDEGLQLLAVNCYCDSDDDIYHSYKVLVENYEFLEHMPFDRDGFMYPALLEAIHFYDVKAFGNSAYLRAEQSRWVQ